MADHTGNRGCAKKLGLAFLLLILVLGALYGVLHLRATAYLERRKAKLAADIEAWEASVVVDRRYPFEDLTDGNAVDDYRELEWLATEPEFWRGPEPENSPRGLGQGDLASCEPSFGLWGYHLSESLDPKKKAKLDPKRLAQVEAHYERYGDRVVAILRRAVRRTRCWWNYEIRKGTGASLPNLLDIRSAVQIMGYKATRSSPREAIELSLEMIAIGQDHGRHPNIIGAMIGVALRYLGFQSLERAMQRELEAEDYRRVLACLDGIGAPPDYDPLCDKLAFDATMASDHSAMVKVTPRGFEGYRGFNRFAIPVVMEWEWRAIDDVHKRMAGWDALTLEEMRERHKTLKEELAGSWCTFAPLAVGDAPESREHIETNAVRRNLGRLTAAAYLHRIEKERWPVSAKELAPYVGEVLEDPYSSDGNFRFEEDDGGWRLSSAFQDPPITMLARRP